MWYVLAAANALSGDSDLIAGTQLKVPEMAASKNDATSFKPYDPNEIVGSTSPELLPAPPPSGCSTIATVIRVVVAVVLAVYAPPAGYAMLIAGAGETVAQTVEINQGYREEYNVGTIVVSAVSAGYSPGGTTAWGQIGMAAVRASVNYAASYAINRALGIEDHFSWRGVATAAVSAAISQAVLGNMPTETAAAQNGTGSMIPSSAPFSWSRVAQGAVVAAKEAGKSVIRSGIGYAVDKAIVGEAHWNWGQVMSSAAVQAGSAFGGSYRETGITYNQLKAQGVNEQDARMKAWDEHVKTNQEQTDVDMKPRLDPLDPNGDGKHTHEDLMYFSASNEGTYALPVSLAVTNTENSYIGRKGFEGIKDDGVVCVAPEGWQNEIDINLPKYEAITNEEFKDVTSLTQEQITAIISAKNIKLIEHKVDIILFKVSNELSINPKILLATLAQEQSWGKTGKIDKLMGVDASGKGGDPASLSVEDSLRTSAQRYKRWYEYGMVNFEKHGTLPALRINHDPHGTERRSVGSQLTVEQNAALDSGYLYTPRTVAEYARLKYTPFTYFAPQNSRPYDNWIKLLRGFK